MSNLFGIENVSDGDDVVDVEKTSKKSNTLPQQQQLSTTLSQKFQSSTLSKGYFNNSEAYEFNDDDGELFSPEIHSPTKILEGRGAIDRSEFESEAQAQDPSTTKRSSRRTKKREAIKLKPLSENLKVEVFRNIADNEKYKSRNSAIERRKSLEKLDELKIGKIKNIKDCENEEEEVEEVEDNEKEIKENEEETISRFEQDETGRKLNEEEEDDEEEKVDEKNQNHNKNEDIIEEIKNEKIKTFKNENIKEENDKEHPNSSSSASQSNSLSKILLSTVRENACMKMCLERNTWGFFDLWPEYSVFLDDDQCFLMSGKKVSRTPYSTYVVSGKKGEFGENQASYFGKAKSSVLGDQLDIFGPGLNPNDAFEKKVKPRELVATVIYETHYLQSGQPRNFKVYLKKPDVDYYQDFKEVKMYQEEISLNLLHENESNRDKIIILANRKPEYKELIKGYMLNFKGRVSIPSVKNFILEDVSRPGEDVMLFGKFENDKYHMDVSAPLSPTIAFGIVLSSFDSKFFCE